MTDYSWVTQEMMDEELERLLDETSAAELLQVPGVAEVLLEHYNNDLLDRIDENYTWEKFLSAHKASKKPRFPQVFSGVCLTGLSPLGEPKMRWFYPHGQIDDKQALIKVKEQLHPSLKIVLLSMVSVWGARMSKTLTLDGEDWELFEDEESARVFLMEKYPKE